MASGDDRSRHRVALAGLTFAAVAPVTYAALRTYEVLRAGKVDVSLVLATTHVDFLWRAAAASWFGLMAAGIAYWRSDGEAAPERRLSGRALAGAVALAVGVAVLASLYP